MSSLENYILSEIKNIDESINSLNRNDYNKVDYNLIFNRLSGQKSILYKCLTAHDNNYKQVQSVKS